MPRWNRNLWLAANEIAQALRQDPQPEQVLPSYALQDLLRLQQKWESAQRRQWRVAAARLRVATRRCASELLGSLQRLVNEVPSRREEPLAGPGDVYRDLAALQAEHTGVEIDRQEKTVSVTTERIVLEGLDLGPFVIEWNWGRIGEEDELRVIAKEAYSPSDREDITHPHVRDNLLCTGQAKMPLDRALHSGRLFDAFLIVRQVLQTYNPESAYITLDDWSSFRCYACGDSVPEDDHFHCETCDADLCGGCLRPCHRCGASSCSSCAATCSECDETVCTRCRPLVNGRRLKVCHTCHEEEESNDAEEANDAERESAQPESILTIPSDGVGEAAVPPGCGTDRNRGLRDQPNE